MMTNWLSPNPFEGNPRRQKPPKIDDQLAEQIEKLGGKPPRKYTQEEFDAVVRYYAETRSLKELRKWQDITRQQIGLAYEQKNREALENQQMMDLILGEAVDKKVFG